MCVELKSFSLEEVQCRRVIPVGRIVHAFLTTGSGGTAKLFRVGEGGNENSMRSGHSQRLARTKGRQLHLTGNVGVGSAPLAIPARRSAGAITNRAASGR